MNLRLGQRLAELEERGLLTPKQLAHWGNASVETARAWIAGTHDMKLATANQIILIAPAEVGAALSDVLHANTGWVSYAPQTVDDIEGGVTDNLRELADFLDLRTTHRADGVVTVEEKENERRRVAAMIRKLHGVMQGVVQQKTTTRKHAHMPPARLAR